MIGTLVVWACALLFATRTPNCQDFDSSSSVNANSVRVAEPLELVLELSAPSHAQVIFPELDSKIGQFDVLEFRDRFGIPSETLDGMSTWVRRITLESIQTGNLVIPEQKIVVKIGENSNTIRMQSHQVRVESVLENRPDPTKFRDIKGLIDVSVADERPRRWIWWVIGAGAAFLFSAFAVSLLIKRKNWVAPDQWAIQELRSLTTSDTDSGQCYGQITAILRSYLGHRFDIAPNAAKQDLVNSVVQATAFATSDLKPSIQLLTNILEKAETAKFACQNSNRTELNRTLNSAIDFIGHCENAQSTSIKSGGNG